MLAVSRVCGCAVGGCLVKSEPRRCPICRRPGLFIDEKVCRDCAKVEKFGRG